jgi:tRNA pseudouridine synthase 10
MMGVGIEREPIALTGRYRKYSRSLPQSPWLVEGQLKCAGSVAEFITQHAVPLYAASDAKFHSAGREDVDVRMLGRGRPFLLELLAPKRPEHTAAEIELLQQRINACGLIEISGLREGSLHAVSTLMKEGEEAHRKEYRAVLVLSRPVTDADLARLNGTSELVVDQLTPMRVMHRRTLMVRQRTIHALSATRLGGRFLQLDLVTQAGTYVKEFCHGDFGRTVPNVGSLLGCSTDIMQLDVLDLQDEH